MNVTASNNRGYMGSTGSDLSKNKRILSLDVFRGITIVLMILVNSQGNSYPYQLLEHAKWNGCTFADVVFPFFLFIVGLTSVISLNKQKTGTIESDIYWIIIKRSILIFALGLFLNIFPYYYSLGSLRIYGILQRIALCYLVCSIIYLNTTVRTQLLIFSGILLGYWLVMTQIPVPGLGVNQLTETGSWVSYLDQLIFSAPHLFFKVYDPEGFFSTIPAIATTLGGTLAGSVLLASFSYKKKYYVLLLAGFISLSLGWAWSFTFPINKNLWTSSFVLWTSGLALIVFALCFWLIDIRGYKKWTLPFKIFGMNAIFAFTFHVILLKLQFIFHFILSDGTRGNMKVAITDYIFAGYSSQNAALMYSLLFLLMNFLVVAFLYRRKIFFKI